MDFFADRLRQVEAQRDPSRSASSQVSAAPQVRAIHSGHIHQAFDGLLQTDPHDEEEGTNTEQFGGSGFQSTLHSAIKVHAAPSTAYQQVPRTEAAVAATAGKAPVNGGSGITR